MTLMEPEGAGAAIRVPTGDAIVKADRLVLESMMGDGEVR